ncbi:MAG: 5-formyltetrahydrofolate cyclo-ligase, partial [Clostridia bacterium]|nr:5-formyltetrahydrofolate cyclo-ligase [Clostridia bacterium]
DADRANLECFAAAYVSFDRFLVYNSFGTEADPKGLIDWLISSDKQVYLPRVEGKDIVPAPYGETKKGAFGVDEPTGPAYAGKIDVAVIPLLAVDFNGCRLGYGGGYYDRYLSKSDALRVGLGYGVQLCERLPEDEGDEPLDVFLCERGIYSFGRK